MLVRDDFYAAHEALMRWFESQGITPTDSIRLMGSCIATVISTDEITTDEIEEQVMQIARIMIRQAQEMRDGD